MSIKTFEEFAFESDNYMPGYPDIIIYDKAHAREIKRALIMAQTTSTVDIQKARYTFQNYNEKNDTIEVKDIGIVPYSELMQFVESKIKQ